MSDARAHPGGPVATRPPEFGPQAPAAVGVPGPVPVLRHRRDGILPAVAAALSVGGQTLTCTGSKAAREPRLHPLVRDFLDSLGPEQRERYAGRCPEAVLLSRYLTTAEAARGTHRTPMTPSEARRVLAHARITARRIREDGDPWHGSYAPPCRSCAALLAHFGVRAVDPTAGDTEDPRQGHP